MRGHPPSQAHAVIFFNRSEYGPIYLLQQKLFNIYCNATPLCSFFYFAAEISHIQLIYMFVFTGLIDKLIFNLLVRDHQPDSFFGSAKQYTINPAKFQKKYMKLCVRLKACLETLEYSLCQSDELLNICGSKNYLIFIATLHRYMVFLFGC